MRYGFLVALLGRSAHERGGEDVIGELVREMPGRGLSLDRDGMMRRPRPNLDTSGGGKSGGGTLDRVEGIHVFVQLQHEPGCSVGGSAHVRHRRRVVRPIISPRTM